MRTVLSLWLFMLGYLILVIDDLLPAVSFVRENSSLLVICGMALIMCRVILNLFNKEKRRKNIIVVLALILVAGISCIFTHNFSILKFFVVILGTIDLAYEDFFRIDFKIRVGVLLAAILLCSLGVAESRDLADYGRGTRYALGFWHPNYLGLQVFVIVVEFSYLYRKWFSGARRLILFLTYVIAGAFIELVPNSRAALLALVAYAVFSLFKKPFRKILFYKFVRWFVASSFVIFSAASIMLVALGGNRSMPLFTQINKATSYRAYYFSRTIEDKGISVLGTQFYADDVPLDNTYLRLLIEYGVLQYLVIATLSILSFKKFYKEKDEFPIEVMLALNIYFMAESSFSVVRNGLTYLIMEPLKGGSKGDKR